jgi:hypothetical protein
MRFSLISPSLFVALPTRASRSTVAVKHAAALHATPVPDSWLPSPATATKAHTFSSITLARTSSSINRQM